MKPFPELYELIEIFESEPVLSDGDIPWYYDCLKFSLSRGADSLECEIEPSYDNIKVRWYQGKRQLMNLTLESVRGIEIEKRTNKEILHIHFYGDIGVKELIMQLKPYIYISIKTV